MSNFDYRERVIAMWHKLGEDGVRKHIFRGVREYSLMVQEYYELKGEVGRGLHPDLLRLATVTTLRDSDGSRLGSKGSVETSNLVASSNSNL